MIALPHRAVLILAAVTLLVPSGECSEIPDFRGKQYSDKPYDMAKGERLLKKYSNANGLGIPTKASQGFYHYDGWVFDSDVVDDALRVRFRLDPKCYPADTKPRRITVVLVPSDMEFERWPGLARGPRIHLSQIDAKHRKAIAYSEKPEGGYEALITLPEDKWDEYVLLVSAEVEPGWRAETRTRLVATGAPSLFTGLFYKKENVDEQPSPVLQTKPELTGFLTNASGVVLVEFIVEKDGSVGQVVPLGGFNLGGAPHDAIMEQAQKCATQWRFKPALRKGKPVRCRIVAPITFGKGL